MASLTNNPYKRFKRSTKGKKLSGSEVHDMMKRKSFTVGKVKHTGSFHGKSNVLGQGGRASQLKARGVPGGVIGNMARSVGAAPGGPNFHKKTKKRKASHKEPTINAGKEGDIEKKKAKKQAPHFKQTLKARKASKKRKGVLGFADVERKGYKKYKHGAYEKGSKKEKGAC